MTQSQRALVGFGALLVVLSVVLTVAWDVSLRHRRDYYTPLVTKPPASATAQQLSSDAYHFAHVTADLQHRWQPGGYAMVGASMAGLGRAPDPGSTRPTPPPPCGRLNGRCCARPFVGTEDVASSGKETCARSVDAPV